VVRASDHDEGQANGRRARRMETVAAGQLHFMHESWRIERYLRTTE
jgi:hypothetical protein